MRMILPLIALLLMACNAKPSACEKSIKDALGNPKSYKTISIVEEEGEGMGVSTFMIKYEYESSEGRKIEKSQSCAYENDSGKVYTDKD